MDSLFITLALKNPFYYFSWVGILAFSICLHEYAHAATALKLGDRTAAEGGHLSLNPMVQMGPSALLFLFLAGIAWGSVPVNPSHYRNRRDWSLVALAGPLANLLLCVVFAAAVVMLERFWPEPSGELAVRFFWVGTVVNATFFLYNLLPIPIFDGWSVLAYFVPRMERIDPQQAQQVALIALLVVFFTPVGAWIWTGGSLLAHTTIGFTGMLLPGG